MALDQADVIGEISRRQSAELSLEKATISDVQDDGTVNVDTVGDDIGLMVGVPCLRSYTNRKVGDVVLLLSGTNYRVVLGAVGVDDTPEDDPVTIRWGTGAPSGTGWVKSDAGDVYVQDDVIYISRYVPDPPPPPPKHSTAGKVGKQPTDEGAYRDNNRETDEPHPIQGAWPSYPHPYRGLWVYGTSIADACAGNTVSKMTVKMTRLKGEGGIYGGATCRLYLHDYTSLPSGNPSLSSPWSPGTLTPGATKTFTLPSSWASALASGSARGIGCLAGTGSDYLHYGNCGDLTIYFA